MKVSGPLPLPSRVTRRGVLKSPFKYGSARHIWELKKHKRLVVYETDADTHVRFLAFLEAVQEPVATVKIVEHSFHRLDRFYRRDLLSETQSTQSSKQV